MATDAPPAAPRRRALNATEALWLTLNDSSSPLCLAATLRGAGVTEAAVRRGLNAAQAKHPYLAMRVDKAGKALVGDAPPTPLSVAVLDAGGADALRAVVAEQLAASVAVETSLTRAHLLTTPDPEVAHLLLVGDHLAFDGVSFRAWLNDVLAAAVGAAAGGGEGHPFVEWQSRVPPLDLKPLPADPAATETLPLLAPPPAAPDAPPVQDCVVTVAPDTVAALKAAGKARGLSLNAPLMTAFGAAVLDVSRAASGKPLPLTVRGLCAVDLRQQLAPPLPKDYVSSAAGMVPCSITVEGDDAAALWAAAGAAGDGLSAAVAGLEAFRLHDIVSRGAFADMGPLFAVPFLWSNVGHLGVDADGLALTAVELHVRGAGSNPLLSGHVVEAGGQLALTVTHAPVFHAADSAARIAQRFVAHVGTMASAAGCDGGEVPAE